MPSFKYRQLGMSVISLMVGLLLAMISILAGMTLYKNIVSTSIEARTDAVQDGQLASALLSVQLELQSAGFGLVPGASQHIALIGAAGASQTLSWRYKPVGGAVTCKAFRIRDVEENTRRQLQLLTPNNPVSCTETAVLGTLAWSDNPDNVTVLAEFRASEAAQADLPAISVTLDTQNCFPYGLGQAADHQMVTITADNAARRAAKKSGTAVPNSEFVYSFCLPNL